MGVSHDTVVEDTMLDVEFAHSDEEGSSETHTETIDGASVGDEEPNGIMAEKPQLRSMSPQVSPILGWYGIRILPRGLRVWMRLIWCPSSTEGPM